MEKLSIAQLNLLLKKLAPEAYNGIIVDESVPVEQHNYCYIQAYGQRVEYRTTVRTVYADDALAQRIVDLKQEGADKPYAALDDRLLEMAGQAPSYGKEALINNAKLKFSELINGGRAVKHADLQLSMEDGRLAAEQPRFVVKSECIVAEDPENKGKLLATLSYFQPLVSEKHTEFVRCADGEIEGLKEEHIVRHRGTELTPKRMLTHLNGIDTEAYDPAISPYLNLIHDRIGDENALEDIYFRIVPCYAFAYRTLLDDRLHRAAIIDAHEQPELLLELAPAGGKLFESVGDGIRSISRLLGALGKSERFKKNEDMLRAARLLIAVAVADGIVREEEKQCLTQAIQGLDALKNSERAQLVALLSQPDGSFLTENDFRFNNAEDADVTLARMQELAQSDGYVHEMESTIIAQLKQYNRQ